MKFLICVKPQGVISFVSKAWGGRTPDNHFTENCGIMKYLLPGDVILADRVLILGTVLHFLKQQSRYLHLRKKNSSLVHSMSKGAVNFSSCSCGTLLVCLLPSRRYEHFQHILARVKDSTFSKNMNNELPI